MKALAQFKFLTYDQMLLLKIDKYKSNLATSLKKLRDRKRPLILKIPHNFAETSRYYISKYGSKILLEICPDLSKESIQMPKGVITKATQDATHREMLITNHIQLDLVCASKKLELVYCKRYFDKAISTKQKGLKSETAIYYEEGKTLKSDMVFILQTTKQKELYLVELERGRNTKKAIEKCEQHLKAILIGSANKVFNFNKGYRVLFLFEEESLMKNTIDKLQTNQMFHNLTEYFLFKLWKEINETNFFEGWVTFTGEERKMFY